LVKKKGYKDGDLLTAGISFERNGKLYDFFRGRIIFPLFDHRSNVTGFSARALTDDNQPKYLNTKETAVYHKGSMFFGLNGAKEEIKLKQDAIIVEGEFDMISLFMEGIKNVVAIKGTALTENQVNLLARFTPKVTLCLDQDNAGFEATRRSLETIEKKGLTTAIITTTEGKDPDEAIKKNPGAFKKAIKESAGVYDYLTEKFVSETDKNTAQGKKDITDNLLPLFSNITNEVIKEHYLKKLSSILDISLASLLKEVEKLQKKDLAEKVIIPLKKNTKTERETAEEYVLALILQSNDFKKTLEDNQTFFDEYVFETQALGKVLKQLFPFFEKREKFDAELFSKSLSKELIPAFDTCYLFPLTKFITDESKYPEEIKKQIARLKEFHQKDMALQPYTKN
jgi:DNA primase